MNDEVMTKQDWQAKDERILKSGIMKSIHEGGRMPEGNIEIQKIWLKDMFDYSVSLIGLGSAVPEAPRQVLTPAPKSWPAPIKNESTKLVVEEIVTSIENVSKKEYKPNKFRYGIQDSEGVWYSSFHRNHFDNASEAKTSGRQVKIYFERGEYNGKPQQTMQSIEVI